ncbi:hypothetical protein QM012_003562 [Aureobasidium pullulans]|uniref:chitinase n=1 Tax=Aureobasidium pullulans TaxID=5580 RepID=A0ABR0T949_AURPU
MRSPGLWCLYLTCLVLVKAQNILSQDKSVNAGALDVLLRRDLPIGTCNSDTPCPNGACCGSNGLCGYSPTECGSGCTSNCNAKAQCGQYGTPGQQNCPLNVCCSQFGFCGETDDFCGKGCQEGFGGCGQVNRPSCSGSSVGKRTIGYYESWANTRTCQSVSPEQLNLQGFTHVNFAFAFFDPSSFLITPMDSNSASLYRRFTALKDKYNGIQTWISVGGWSFTDPGPTRTAFSDMTSTVGNRKKFIDGLISFMNTYGFDGVDLDWEYPQADDRGGVASDKENYVALVKEMKAALGPKGMSMTLPTSYWYLQHFDVKAISQYVDWFNFMAYDLHGTWDADSKFVGPYIAPHTNLTEIDLGLDLLWRAGVDSSKVVLGEGWYGRSFTLTDPSCNTPNGICQFSGGADPGPCSGTSGILTDQEIQDIINQYNVEPVHDEKAGVKWITWNSNQWVSYDDDDTFEQKKDFANSRCLGGTMVWAIDQKDQIADNGLGKAPGVTVDQQADAQQMSNDQAAKLTCYTTDCNAKCKKGTNEVTQMNGQPGQLSTSDRCPKNQYRSLCCNDGTTLGKCQWRGYRGAGLSCIQGCSEGETELVTDTNNHGKKDQTCNGGLQSYCCSGFKAPPTKGQVEKAAADAAKDAAEAAAEQLALDVAAKAFCRLAVPALLAPLELAEDLIPIIGEILDIAEIAATPALIQACVKGVEKEGKAEFKVFGKKHTLSFDEPEKPPETRPPKSSHSPASTCQPAKNAKRGKAPKACSKPTTTLYKPINPMVTEHPEFTRECDGSKWPQACLHYSSVIRVNGPVSYNPLTCPSSSRGVKKARQGGKKWQVVAQWNGEHNGAWSSVRNQDIGWMQESDLDCERDEYPPIGFWQGNTADKAFVRLINSHDNGGAGAALFPLDICSHDSGGKLPTSTSDSFSKLIHGQAQDTAIYERHLTVTIGHMSIKFINIPNLPDDGITANKCFPSVLRDDPGFALMLRDSWYNGHPNDRVFGLASYNKAPSANVIGTNVAQPNHFKRNSYFDPDDIILDDGNSTRKATDQELAEEFGFYRCESSDCRKELDALGVESPVVVAPPRTVAVDTPAATTSVLTETTSTLTPEASAGGGVQDRWMRMMARPTGHN